MTIGKMIMLGALGVVTILVLAAGGIVWYVQSSRAAEERERLALMNAKATEAKEAIKTTLKSSADFAALVSDLRAKSEKEVKSASDAFLAMLDPEMREACRTVLIAPETKDYTDAVADYAAALGKRVKAFYEGQVAEARILRLTGGEPLYHHQMVLERED